MKRYTTKRSPRTVKWPLLLGVVLVGLLLFIGLLAGPWPYRVRIANLGTRSLSVSWLTSSSNDGCAWLFSKQRIPVFKAKVCEGYVGKTHLVTFHQLDEANTYYALIYSKGIPYIHSLQTVTTYVTKDEARMPAPAYGSVRDMAGKPVPFALVYAYPAGGNGEYPEATRANEQGNYALDLGFNGSFADWIIEAGSGTEQWNARLVSGQVTTPLPLMEVSVHE